MIKYEGSLYDAYIDFLEVMGVWLRMTPAERIARFLLRLFWFKDEWIFARFKALRER